MPPQLLAPKHVDIEADGLGLVHACCARLAIPDTLRNAISARLGVAADHSVQFLAPLTDAEGIDTVENVALVNEDGTFNLQYDDGDQEFDVRAALVRRLAVVREVERAVGGVQVLVERARPRDGRKAPH